jgi:hypothetical protein
MDSFLHEKNLELLRRHLAESDPTKSPLRQEMLLRLLVERAGDSCPRWQADLCGQPGGFR